MVHFINLEASVTYEIRLPTPVQTPAVLKKKTLIESGLIILPDYSTLNDIITASDDLLKCTCHSFPFYGDNISWCPRTHPPLQR